MMGNRFTNKNHHSFLPNNSSKLPEAIDETQKMVGDGEDEEFPLSQRKIIAQLVWRGQNFELYDGENFIGRDQQCEVVLDQKSVSSKHAEIIIKNGSTTVRDLRSSNGTFVEDPAGSGKFVKLSALDNLRVIQNGTKLRFGMVCCQFFFNDIPNDPSLLETQFLDRKLVPEKKHILDQDTLIDEPMEIIESDATVGMTEDEDEEEAPASRKSTLKTKLSPFTTTPQLPLRNPILESATLVDPILDGPHDLPEEDMDEETAASSDISQDLMAPIEEVAEENDSNKNTLKANSSVSTAEQLPPSSKSSRKSTAKLDRTPTLKQNSSIPETEEETPKITKSSAKGKAASRLLLDTPLNDTPEEPRPKPTSSKKKPTKVPTPAKELKMEIETTPVNTKAKNVSPPSTMVTTAGPSTQKKRSRKAVLEDELNDSVETPKIEATPIASSSNAKTDGVSEIEDSSSARKKKRLSFNLDSLQSSSPSNKQAEAKTSPESSNPPTNPVTNEKVEEEKGEEKEDEMPNKKRKVTRGKKQAEPVKAPSPEPEPEAVPVPEPAKKKAPPAKKGKGKASSTSAEIEEPIDNPPVHPLALPPQPVRLMFTKVEESDYSKQLKKIKNIEITNDPTIATHCITTKELKRTPKLMVGLNSVLQYVIHDQWITDSAKAGKPIPILAEINASKENYQNQLVKSSYVVKDADKEQLWNFQMVQTLTNIRFALDPETAQRLPDTKVFLNYAFYVTDGICGVTAPSEEDLVQIITSGGGSWMTTIKEYEDLLNGNGNNNNSSKGNKGSSANTAASRKRKSPPTSSSSTAETGGDASGENKKTMPLIVISHQNVAKKEISPELIETVKKSGVHGIYSIEFIFKAVLRQQVDLEQDFLPEYEF